MHTFHHEESDVRIHYDAGLTGQVRVTAPDAEPGVRLQVTIPAQALLDFLGQRARWELSDMAMQLDDTIALKLWAAVLQVDKTELAKDLYAEGVNAGIELGKAMRPNKSAGLVRCTTHKLDFPCKVCESIQAKRSGA